MEKRNFEELDRIFEEVGGKIEDMVNRAMNSQDYRDLGRNIGQTVNKAIDSGNEVLKKAFGGEFHPEHNARAYETHKEHGYQKPPFGSRQKAASRQEIRPVLYGNTTVERLKGMALTVTGGVLSCGMTVGLAVTLIAKSLGISHGMITGSAALMGVGILGGLFLLTRGIGSLGRLGRFGRYKKALGTNTYCNFEQLSRMAGKSVKYVKKDIRYMIHKGWFPEGHIDVQETCLITSNETYDQYMEAQKQLEKRQKERRAQDEREASISPQVQEVLDKGNEYLAKIRESNDAIPGQEISDKISRMELIVQKIFERAAEHPEIIPDLKRLMDYYLPTTVKLLEAYEDMDSQPVQGENIKASKKEIETTLDTLNQAFEKLLDSVFKDVAWDVSSDITVLHAMLAQEGLTEDDFEKMRRKAKENSAQVQ